MRDEDLGILSMMHGANITKSKARLQRKHRLFDVESWELDDLPVAELNGD